MHVSCMSGLKLFLKAGVTQQQTCTGQQESSCSITFTDELSNHTCRTTHLYANMPGAAMVIALLCPQARRRVRERIYRTRINVFGMGELEVYHIFIFSPDAILELATALHGEITSQTEHSHAVQPLVKVLATLHFLASGSFQRTSGVVSGMSQSTMSRCVHQVVPAILTRMSHHIIKPIHEHLRQKAMQDFYSIAGFPRTVGAIDCTHVALWPPPVPQSTYTANVSSGIPSTYR